MIYWEFDPLSSPRSFSRRASTPPPLSTTVALRPRRTNKSFVDPGLVVEWPTDRRGGGGGKLGLQREKNKGGGGGRVVEWDESEDRLLSDTGRACKLIERGEGESIVCKIVEGIQCGCFVSSI